MIAVVQLQLRGRSEKDLIRFRLNDRAALYDAGSRYAVAGEATPAGALTGDLELVPFTVRRGALAFAVDEKHGPLALAVDLPGYAPLRLALAPSAGGEPPKAKAPRALFTIRDGETLLVAVQAVRTAAQVKEARPEAEAVPRPGPDGRQLDRRRHRVPDRRAARASRWRG